MGFRAWLRREAWRYEEHGHEPEWFVLLWYALVLATIPGISLLAWLLAHGSPRAQFWGELLAWVLFAAVHFGVGLWHFTTRRRLAGLFYAYVSAPTIPIAGILLGAGRICLEAAGWVGVFLLPLVVVGSRVVGNRLRRLRGLRAVDGW